MDQPTVLWPTDLSKGSLKAAPQVMELARQRNARVVVLYVSVDLCSYFPAYGNFPSPERLQEFQGWEMETARAALEGICATELAGCPNLAVRLVTGNAAAQILKAAKDENAKLIVMTSRGQSLDNREPGRATGLGSVARQVLEQSSTPVQIVYPQGPQQGAANGLESAP